MDALARVAPGSSSESLDSSLSRRSALKLGAAASVAGVTHGARAIDSGALHAVPSTGLRSLAQDAGGVLTIANSADPSTLDPHVNSVTRDGIFLHALFDNLIERSKEGDLFPSLATEWAVAADNVTWTLKLRQDVVFHDGTPFNAEAVVYNFDRMVDPAIKSEYAVFQIGPYASSRAVDEFTVEVTMSEPYGLFPASLSTFGLGMVSPTAAMASGVAFGQNPVGSGPFRFVEWVEQDHVTLERNPDYNWGSTVTPMTGPPQLAQIVMRTIAENATRAAALQSGEVNMAFLVASDYITFEGNPEFTLQMNAGEGYPPPGMFINQMKAPTDDILVRKALAFGVDKDEINLLMYEGLADPADSVTSTFAWSYNPASALYSFDPDQAAALLDEAGWVMGDGEYRMKDGVELAIVDLSLPGVQQIAEIVQAQLRNLGVRVDLLVQDNPAQQQSAQNGDHNLVWTQWGGVDPGDLRKVYGSENIGSGWNFSHYNNPEIDAMFVEGAAINDQEARKPIYDAITMKLMEDCTIIPLNNASNFIGMASSVKGTEYADERGTYPRLYSISIEG